MPRLWGSMGKFLIKNAVLGEKSFPHEAFCLLVVAEMFLELALFLETPFLNNSWVHA